MTIPALPARLAVPPGRLSWALPDGRRVLRTLIDADGWDRHLARGRALVPDPARAEPDFFAAYAWMSDRHAEHVPGSRGGPLLWLWARVGRDSLVDMVRHDSRSKGSGTGSVLLTVAARPDRFLLSDFMEWHAVLNKWPARGWSDPPDADTDAADPGHLCARLDAALPGWRDAPPDRWPAALAREMLGSWDRCLGPVVGPPARGGTWQAVMDSVRPDEVLAAVRVAAPSGPALG